jgi:hypothetical protein
MSIEQQLRPLTGLPDHGHGPLGQLAHAVIAEYLDAPPRAPFLHMGQNTLPDPPFPMASAVHFADLTDGWRQFAPDLVGLLAAGARSLRSAHVPDGAAYSEPTQKLQKLLRLDSIALACEARAIEPTESVAGWTLAADVLAGRRDPQDLDLDIARPSVVTWVVDRAGTALLGWAPASGTAGDITVTANEVPDHPVIGQLRQILDTQYAWTTAVFGSCNVPGSHSG